MSVWKQVGQNLAGLAKHVVKTTVAEPMEVVKDAVGEKLEQGQQTQQNSDDQNQNNPMNDLAKAGFKNKEDFERYENLSGKKDDVELQLIRRNLQSQWGLDTNLASGMQRAQQEWEEKERQRKEVKEKEEEQKKEFEFQKKQEEDAQVSSAQRESNPENKAWGAG
jgi:hypothetical protein